MHIHIHTLKYIQSHIHIHITNVECFIVCYLIGDMDIQALFAAVTHTTLDVYENNQDGYIIVSINHVIVFESSYTIK